MKTSKHYLYLWRHKFVDPDSGEVIERTCFGITSNPRNRIKGYEGHVGHKVRFSALWVSDNKRLIQELEQQIKDESYDSRVAGFNNKKYEWINETVRYEDLYDWVELTLVPSVIGVEPADIPEVMCQSNNIKKYNTEDV